jgi:hypothetical protein
MFMCCGGGFQDDGIFVTHVVLLFELGIHLEVFATLWSDYQASILSARIGWCIR